MNRPRRLRIEEAVPDATTSHPDAPGPVPGPWDDRPEDEGPSKSQRKRDMHALQDLGERLVVLSEDRLRRMDLPIDLLDAVLLARRVTAREGRRRQLQYVGKLMRRADAEAIQAQLDVDGAQHRLETAIMHAAERWRDALVESPERLSEFVERYPLAAGGSLHATLRAARTEVERGEKARRFRDLFRELRDVMIQSNA